MASIYEHVEVDPPAEDLPRWLAIERKGRDATDDFIVDPYGSGRPASMLARAVNPGSIEPDLATPADTPEPMSGAPESAIANAPSQQDAVNPRNVMVVHGRDLSLRDDMFNLLRAWGLAPLEWSQLVSLVEEGSPYVGRILERAFEVAQAAVVLFSPDDEARLSARLRIDDEPDNLKGQARPNVFFEAGLAFGRFPDKSILVEFGDLRAATDLAGRHVLRFDGSAERRHELAERLIVAGCPVDRSGSDWLRVGRFSIGES